MKYLLFVFTVVILTFSCKKEEVEENYHSSSPNWGGFSKYYFKGTVKDTSNNNNLLSSIIGPGSSSCTYNAYTLTDSTFIFHYSYDNGKIPCGLDYLDVVLRDSNSVITHTWIFQNPGWIPNDTIKLDLFF